MKGSEKKPQRFFPSPSALLRHPDPDGVVAVDGDLSVPVLLEAYRSGIFPWPTSVQLHPRGPLVTILLWFCPPERAILEFSHLRINRSLKRARQWAAEPTNSKALRFTENQAFSEVMKACATVPRPGSSGTWITQEMLEAYMSLFEAGYVRSVEVWDTSGELVGGVYGVEIDGTFSAESMFHRVDNASKLALLHLMETLHTRGIDWIDIQMMTPHLEKLGARTLSRADYLHLLKRSRKGD
jgi:leucyl/phenylalanyl-tRNA--protein transferase